MPELPEVETIRAALDNFLAGRKIERVRIHETRLRFPLDSQALLKYLPGQTINHVQRRSKYLVFLISNQAKMLIHLGMSGRLGIFRPSDFMEKHVHIIFDIDDHYELRFRDPRRFGFVEVIAPETTSDYPRFASLGPEPLDDEFNSIYFAKICRKTKRPIKNLLMDARAVVGIGNIYANEALFFAGVNPCKPADQLTESQIDNLVKAAKDILHKAIEKGGTTFRDYRNGFGEPGFFQFELAVYDRQTKPCKNCQSPIQRIKLSGRGTFICPRCQK